MAARSEEVEDGDLIDLDSGGVCSRSSSSNRDSVISRGGGAAIAEVDRGNSNDSHCDSQLQTLEENEHLLDVCPPKLEQKLSLTLKKRDPVSGDINDTGADNDVLVTLGHDKVVPISKRIDVVSSDTIKRVKDITKNLEPVIQKVIASCGNLGNHENEEEMNKDKEAREIVSRDTVDNGYEENVENEAGILMEQDFNAETFEMREINDAFNFLTELEGDYDYENDDDDVNGLNESISSDGPLIMDADNYLSNYESDEKMCEILDDENRGGCSSCDSDEFKSVRKIINGCGGKKNRDEILLPRSYSSDFKHREYSRGDFENFGFDHRRIVEDVVVRNSRKSKTVPRNFQNKIIKASAKSAGSFKSHFDSYKSQASKFHSLRNSLQKTPKIYENEDEEIRILADGKFRRSLQTKYDRKSWSEGVPSFSSVLIAASESPRDNIRFQRSNSLDIHCDHLLPSTSNGTKVFQRSDAASIRKEDDDTSEISSSASSSSSSSSASDVDWSWVEEVESSRAKISTAIDDPNACNNHDYEHRQHQQQRDIVEEEEIPTTPSSANITTIERMRQPSNTVSNSTHSIVMSGVPTAKSLSVPGCPGPPNEHSTLSQTRNNNNATSWVRESMRRLRHLRLPEAGFASVSIDRELSSPAVAAANTATASSSSSSTSSLQRNHAIISAPNSLPDIALIAPDILAAQTNGNSSSVSVASSRPASAPTSRVFGVNVNGNSRSNSPGRGRLTGGRSRGRNQESRRSNSLQSRATVSDTSCSSSSGTSTDVTSPASTPNATPNHLASSGRRICERQRGADRDDERSEEDDEDENPLGRWPHALSPALACLGCTLGLFNISRFAVLSIQFGANFIVQFLVLSLILGIPLFTLQVCLGQRLAAGAVDMWRISPLFQGVGIALLTAQAFIGIYSIVGVSWMFVYFRDSFITKQDRYRWAEPFLLYRDDTKPMHNGTPYKLQETVPDYFSGAVLQRHNLNEPDTGIVTLKFQVAFNLAVVWMIVFVSLSKGLRSYGKVVYVFTLVPVFGTLVLCAKLLGLTPSGSIHQLFPATVWSEFFINGKSWMAASTEVFLTWGLFGAAAMQIAAHNKHKHLLQRDTSLVVVLTLVVLLLSAFLANTCVQILRHQGYIYTTSSFESISGYTFMHLLNQPIHPGQISSPERFMNHGSFLAGQRVIRHGADLSMESGYQVLRLATELVPATLAILGSEQVSPFWAILFYFILILFGIAQQLAIWHCVITGIMAINTKMMKLWETTITFFSCACGYILGLPMATEFGIYVVYYLDYTVGGAWWIMVLYLVEVGAVFAVRGRPHTGEAVVAELFPPTGRCLRHWAGPLLSFTWNVVLPVALMVLSIMIFKSSGFRDLYTYRRTGRDYWAVWARQLGAAIQLIPILMIPVVAIIQTCRYLNSGPPDIFDVRVRRIQLLYRPSLEPDEAADSQIQIGTDATTSLHGNGILPSATDVPFEDPPPKYTPPPSYTTATGARIAKMLRQSFRRSVRRIANVLGESSTPRSRPALQPPPPDYATVLVEMNQGIPSRDISIIVTEAGPDLTDSVNGRRNTLERRRPNTIDRTMRISTIDRTTAERSHSTMDRNRRTQTNNGSSNLTAADVANLLRSSIRRGTSRNQQSLHRSFAINEPTAAISIENLVEGAAPIGQDSLVLPKDESLVSEQDENDYKKTVDETENATTVI